MLCLDLQDDGPNVNVFHNGLTLYEVLHSGEQSAGIGRHVRREVSSRMSKLANLLTGRGSHTI
jgi:hypothetical protein